MNINDRKNFYLVFLLFLIVASSVITGCRQEEGLDRVGLRINLINKFIITKTSGSLTEIRMSDGAKYNIEYKSECLGYYLGKCVIPVKIKPQFFTDSLIKVPESNDVTDKCIVNLSCIHDSQKNERTIETSPSVKM